MSANPDAAEHAESKSVVRKSVEALIEEQGVAKSATFEELLGSGRDLWADDADFERFLEHLQSIRREKD